MVSYLLEKSKNSWNPLESRELSICIVGRLSISKSHKEILYALQELTESLKQKERVNFLGSIPNKDIWKIFSKCFASISASKSEAFGIVNIEPLREATPVIYTNTEGSKGYHS